MNILNDAIPKAITGTYPLSLEDLARILERQKIKHRNRKTVVDEVETNIKKSFSESGGLGEFIS